MDNLSGFDYHFDMDKNREELIKEIENYLPFNEQEKQDKTVILKALKEEKDIFNRSNVTHHMTASVWIVNKERTKTIMAYHNIFRSWSWLGGHADGNENLFEIALKEAHEECGAQHITPLSDKIYSLEILTANGHFKNGKYVSSHLHLNVTYLVEIDENDSLMVKQDENSSVKWFTFQEALEASSETWVKVHIYQKLIDKLPFFKN